MKQNGVSQDNISLNLFPISLTHEAKSWFYHLKTHSIHTWEEMILKFLSKYYPHSIALQLRKDILNFQQLPMESVFEAWERFKSRLRKCPDHRILFLNQILTFYNGITMIDQEKFMVAAGDFDESDDDEPSVMIEDQKSIHHLSGSPTPSFESVVECPSPLPTPFGDSDSFVEETDTLLSHFDNSPPEYETFSFDIEEKNSGSTTTHSDYSLPDYDAFYFDDDHIKEKSNDSTTTHFDFSLPEYDSFIFDLSIDPFPPADRSDSHHEEFADKLTHITSPPEYDRFYFDIEPDLGELTILFEENISKDSTKELTSLELNDFPFPLSDCDSTFSEEFFEIDRLVLFPSRNKDKIFDPGIFIIKRV
ncbi:reverse transcriptase domain-containing protein [Tanacetum coccineum]